MTDAHPEAGLHLAWTRQLYRWWHHYNGEYLAGVLSVPQIVLNDSETALGHWDLRRRRLAISLGHVRRDPWTHVMETLRHEMAHQYADEVLRPQGETAHGRAFGHACERLRCRTPNVQDPSEPEFVGDGILRRLQKVLSLTGSPNENEAQAAMHKARRLLLRYNIDTLEYDAGRCFDYRVLGDVKGRRAAYELWMAQILHRFFFVEVLWAPSYVALDDRAGTVLHIYGTEANLDMAEYVYDYLAALLQGLWPAYRRDAGLKGNRERLRYTAGVLEGLHDRLEEEDGRVVAGSELVWLGDPELQRYYRHLNPRVRTRQGGGGRGGEAYEDGLRQGRQVRIHRPLAEASASGRPLLGA